MMDSKKVLSALSYFSVFFAGFIFPLVVFFASENPFVKVHAKKAFLSHLIPLIALPVIFLAIPFELFSNPNDVPVFFLIGIGLSVILSLIVVIWNIVKGVQILAAKE